MNSKYELNYVMMSDEEVTEFSYNITSDEIGQYVLQHQAEFEIWKGLEYLKGIVKSALNVIKPIDISIRRKFLKNLRKKGVIADE